jgi:hypothetical protein
LVSACRAQYAGFLPVRSISIAVGNDERGSAGTVIALSGEQLKVADLDSVTSYIELAPSPANYNRSVWSERGKFGFVQVSVNSVQVAVFRAGDLSIRGNGLRTNTDADMSKAQFLRLLTSYCHLRTGPVG